MVARVVEGRLPRLEAPDPLGKGKPPRRGRIATGVAAVGIGLRHHPDGRDAGEIVDLAHHSNKPENGA